MTASVDMFLKRFSTQMKSYFLPELPNMRSRSEIVGWELFRFAGVTVNCTMSRTCTAKVSYVSVELFLISMNRGMHMPVSICS
jgi:hypothetical protein